MTVHFRRDLDMLKKELFVLSGHVEENFRNAIDSVHTKNAVLAMNAIEKDINIDNKEVYIEELCLKILALHQPVAADLRFVVAVIKINNDLERIGDLTVNIAERALYLAGCRIDFVFNLHDMALKALTMVKQSLDALVSLDHKLAQKVRLSDDEVDNLNRNMYRRVESELQKNNAFGEAWLHILSISRHLERIADHATNIAEDVMYMIDGTIQRHKTENYNPSD